MVEVWLPYGKIEVPVSIPSENFLGLIDVKGINAVEDPSEEILRAINSPISNVKLNEIAKPGDKAAIVVDNQLFPSNLVLSVIIDKLNNLGINDSEITLILGCTAEDVVRSDYLFTQIAEEIAKRVNIVPCRVDDGDFTSIGYTSRGTKVDIKNAFTEADLRILTSRIAFHPYAGYSGGRSGILPAICGLRTIKHSIPLILNSNAKSGYLERNPVHKEMEEAAYLAKVNFILNVVLNTKGEVLKAFAGDLNRAFMEGAKLMNDKFKISVERKANIVIFSSGGFPSDVSLYRACDKLAAALNIVTDNGVIIWVAECSEGYGSTVFYNWMSNFKTARQVSREIKKNFMLGGDMALLLLKALENVKIILVSIIPDYYATGIFKLRTARTVNDALKTAFRLVGKDSKVFVLPHANNVLPIIKNQ